MVLGGARETEAIGGERKVIDVSDDLSTFGGSYFFSDNSRTGPRDLETFLVGKSLDGILYTIQRDGTTGLKADFQKKSDRKVKRELTQFYLPPYNSCAEWAMSSCGLRRLLLVFSRRTCPWITRVHRGSQIIVVGRP